MPIYEYECERCSLRFELRRSFDEAGSGNCPQCGDRAQRLFAQVPIIFKGSGFYVTDYRKNSGSPEEKPAEKADTGKKDDK